MHLAVSPMHLAVYCDETTDKGSGLGAKTMLEMRRYSVVGAIKLSRLAARARVFGVGLVSILGEAELATDLTVSADWRLVAHLCVGWPETNYTTPELETLGWDTHRGHLPVETR